MKNQSERVPIVLLGVMPHQKSALIDRHLQAAPEDRGSIEMPNDGSLSPSYDRMVPVRRGAVLLCLDLSQTAEQGLNNVNSIYSLLQYRGKMENTAGRNVQFVLVGINSDARTADTGAILRWAEEKNLRYVECSANTGEGVEKVFETAKNLVLDYKSEAQKKQEEQIHSDASSKATETKKSKAGLLSRLRQGAAKVENHSPSQLRTMEITLSNLDLSQSDEKRKKWKAISTQSNAYVLGQIRVFGRPDVTVGTSSTPVPEGRLSVMATKNQSSADAKDDSKLTITLVYHDEAAALEMMGDITRNVAKELTGHLDVTINHDDSNKLNAALEASNVSPREQEVIRVTITGMDRYLNADKGSGPKPLFPDEGYKRMHYDTQEDLHTITQTKELAEGDVATVITASSSEYRDPNQQTQDELKTDGKITVEFRPQGNVTELSDAAVQAFARVVTDMKRDLKDADVVFDIRNPPKYDDSLSDLPKKMAPTPVATVNSQAPAPPRPKLEKRVSLESFEDKDEDAAHTTARPSWTNRKQPQAAPTQADVKEERPKKGM